MDTTLKVEGLVETRRALVEAGGKELGKAVREANKGAAERVRQAALPRVPVRSGRLKGSVRAMASQTSGAVKAGSEVRVPYAAAIHWGEGAGNINHTSGGSVRRPARNIRGRPFLWDAADAELRRVIDEYEQAIDELIDRVVR